MRYLRVRAKDAESARSILAKKNILDKRARVLNSARYVLLPVIIDGQKTIKVIEGLGMNAGIVERKGERAALRTTYRELLEKRLTEEELSMVARGYDVLGNIAIVELFGDLGSKEKEVGKAMVEANANISTVLAKSGPVSGVYRKRKLRRIYGEDTYMALYKENGCAFRFDVRKAFFSSRLSFERGRVDRLSRDGESVAVAGAGVGPYAIEIAKHHPRSAILAVELNRSACADMKRNIILNRTPNVEPVLGDFNKVAMERRGYADRVIVPMPTVSMEMLPSIFAVAKAKALVHLYTFYRTDGIKELKDRIRQAAKGHGRSAVFKGQRVVRPYSKDEIELCLDIMLGTAKSDD